MFESLADWIYQIFKNKYQLSLGQWVDTDNVEYIAAIIGSGGSAIDVEDRRLRFTVILASPRNSRNKAMEIYKDAQKIVKKTMEEKPPCNAASVRIMAEPVGPSYTDDNRAWCLLEIEMII